MFVLEVSLLSHFAVMGSVIVFPCVFGQRIRAREFRKLCNALYVGVCGSGVSSWNSARPCCSAVSSCVHGPSCLTETYAVLNFRPHSGPAGHNSLSAALVLVFRALAGWACPLSWGVPPPWRPSWVPGMLTHCTVCTGDCT